MSRLIASWNELPRTAWDAAHTSAGASYQQDWSYGVALKAASPGVEILRASIARADGSLVALAQIVARPFALVGRFALCTHGPAWVGAVTADEKRETYRLLKMSLPQGWPRLLVFTPNEPADDAAGLSGMSRVMTGDATVLIDLSREEAALRSAMESSWRNKLSKAERSDLVLQKSGLKPAQYRWLIDAEIKQRQKRGYRAMPLELTETWQDAKAEGAKGDRGAGLAVFRADMGRDPAAGMLFLIHGSRATYHVGWTSEAGRDNAAHNLILWSAMKDLKARGVTSLDLGGVNTQSGAGIARFKLETGGAVLQRAGAYV
ncbi:MAG TPA: GNAT family N-acetyltransferase [Hyphomonadaceae bacterium]|nr:GNAT family N-acetyltransferase [Hyphomonadaceae bacterium]HPN05298.1 GNAT family N-acetyltransferase [Hyphomonadaceae bacterium]